MYKCRPSLDNIPQIPLSVARQRVLLKIIEFTLVLLGGKFHYPSKISGQANRSGRGTVKWTFYGDFWGNRSKWTLVHMYMHVLK